MVSMYARMPVRPPWTVEVQVLQEQKTCHAAYGLRQRVPFQASSSLLDNSNRSFLINNMIIFDDVFIEHARFY